MAVSADYINGYQTGFADKTAGKANAYPPSSAPAPAPASIVIKPADDILAIMKALKGGETLQLVAGASYSWPAPINGAAAYTLQGNGASVTFPSNLMAKDMNVCFWISHAGTTITGVDAYAAAGTSYTLFRVYAPNAVISGNHIGAGFCNAIITDMGGTAVRFTNNIVGVTSSCSVFASQDNGQFADNSFAGSLGETTFRTDFTVPGKQSNPNGVVVTGNLLHSIGGTNQKGIVEFRQLGTGCEFTNNTCYDYVRVGQDNQTTPAGSVGGLLIQSNNWPVIAPSIVPNQCLMIKNGIVQVTGNTFVVNAATVVATCSGHAHVAFKGNVRKLLTAGIVPQAKIFATDGSCVITDDGGTIAAA